MIKAIGDYFSALSRAFGGGWTRFWFTPSDPSMLSLMRLLVGIVAVYLHATLSFDLVQFFGPGGLLPASEIAPLEASSPSYLNSVHTVAELWTVHLIGLAILLLFTAGLWTRFTTILALFVFLSDVNRAPMITGLTEPIVAMLLLYLCLAPCGARFSLDRWLARRKSGAAATNVPDPPLSTTATIATRLIQLHLCLWVAMMGFSKLTGDTWWTGLGIWWLVAREDSRVVDFTWLHATPKLLDLWSHAVVMFELTFPVLVWVPLARPLLLALAAVVWGSLALLTGDLVFPLAMLIAALAFVPANLANCCGLQGTRSPNPAQ